MKATARKKTVARKRQLEPDQWQEADAPPPFEFVAQAATMSERLYLLGAYQPRIEEPQCYADDELWLSSGSCVPTLFQHNGEQASTEHLVRNLALAEAPLEIIVRVLQQKRREEGRPRDVRCAEFITEEMVRHEFRYAIEVFPYEAQAEVASATLLSARLGNPKALEIMVQNKMPWSPQSGAPSSSKSPWQVSGELRITRDENIAASHSDNEPEEQPPEPSELTR